MENKQTVDVIIPVYKPDNKLSKLINRLMRQTVRPNHIYVIETIDDGFSTSVELLSGSEEFMTVLSVKKEDFDHGRTRNYGALHSEADYMLFMTQDAVPTGMHLIENLLVPFAEPNVAISYARQIADKGAGVLEELTRTFNYPPGDRIKSVMDLDHLGIKTYFSSNVCALYKKEYFDKMGGFVNRTIFNEDMIMSAKLIHAGYMVAYASSAKVIHSHKYTYMQQFRRNFDLGVSQKQYHEFFENVLSESEGIKMVKQTIGILLKRGKGYLIPEYIVHSAFKFLGYRLGKHYEVLPEKYRVWCSMNQEYWQEEV